MPYTDLLKALKGERLSSVLLPDGTLISASATPHCGGNGGKTYYFNGKIYMNMFLDERLSYNYVNG